MLDKGTYLSSDAWNPNPWAGIHTYTSGVAFTVSANMYAKVIVARLRTGNATITLSGNTDNAIVSLSGGTINNYVSKSAAVSLTVTNADYIVATSQSNSVGPATMTITDN